jgi:hypothetical protein
LFGFFNGKEKEGVVETLVLGEEVELYGQN